MQLSRPTLGSTGHSVSMCVCVCINRILWPIKHTIRDGRIGRACLQHLMSREMQFGRRRKCVWHNNNNNSFELRTGNNWCALSLGLSHCWLVWVIACVRRWNAGQTDAKHYRMVHRLLMVALRAHLICNMSMSNVYVFIASAVCN